MTNKNLPSLDQPQARGRTWRGIIAAAALAVLAACGGGGSGNGSSANIGGGAGPIQAALVEVSSAGSSSIDVSWLPATDLTTLAGAIRYQVHASNESTYLPTAATLMAEGTGILSVRLTGLQPATRYTIRLLAINSAGFSSVSLPLTVTTSSIPSETIPGVVVFTPTDAQVAAVTDAQITLTADAAIPQVGQFIASTQGDGLLRQITQVSTVSGQTVVQTGPASVNQLVKNIEISSAFVLTSVPAEVPSTQAGIAVTPGASANLPTEIAWPQTQFRLSSVSARRAPTTAIQPRQTGLASIDTSNIDVSSLSISKVGKWTTFSGPHTIGIVTGTKGGADLTLEVKNDDKEFWTNARIPIAICKVEVIDNAGAPSLVGIATITPTRTETIENYEAIRQATQRISINATDVAARAEPYTVTLRAFTDEAGNGCQGSFRAGIGWKEKLDIIINVVVVSTAEFPRSESKKIDFTGDFTVSSDVLFTFDPRLEAEVKLNGAGRIVPAVDFARLEAKGRAEISQRITVTATGAGTIDKTKTLIESRKFVKVYMAGAVPIVMSGEFSADLRVQGNVTGAITAFEEITFSLEDISYGLIYEGGAWRTSQHVRPTYRLKISGDANASANLNISLVPRLSIKFYEAASGRLVISPYLQAEAGLHGQVIADITPTDSISDADYWLTKGQLSGGIDAYVMADLSIWDHTFVKWPDTANIADYTTFKKIALVSNTKIVGVPTLTAIFDGLAVHPTDSRAFLIKGQAAEVLNPFKSLFGGPDAFLTFANWTAPRVIAPNNTGYYFVPAPAGSDAGDVWIVFSNPGTYKVRLSGNSSMGGWARQIAEVDVVITDANNNGIIDQWESKFGFLGSGLSVATGDPDGDGWTTLQEYQQGLNPVVRNAVTTPTCVLPQVLNGGVCVTPVVPTCTLPQVLTGGVCVTPIVPTCTLPQVLSGGVCVSPPPTVATSPSSFVATGSMNIARIGHTATRLADGRVLVTGGDNSGNTAPYQRSSEIYDPTTGLFAFTGDMATGRGGHTATLLANGKVLITGGFDQYTTDHTLSSAEIFDPATGRFEPTGSLMTKRAWHTATSLNDGRVLIAGGFDNKLPVYGTYLRLAEIYDPGTGLFTATGDMALPRIWFAAHKLVDGKVLVAGGSDGYGRWTGTAEVFDPTTGMFSSAGSMVTPRWIHNAATLPDGTVLFAGGNSNIGGEVRLRSSEIYDPVTRLFSSSNNPNMSLARAGATITTLFDGRVLVAGGGDGAAVYKSGEIFNAALRTFSSASNEMSSPRYGHTATALKDGRVLLTGGTGANGQALSSSDLFLPPLFATSFRDDFNGTSLDPTKWNSAPYAAAYGDPSVAGGFVHLANCQSADTKGKVAFKGAKIVVEARFAGQKATGRDSNITLTDPATGSAVIVHDTNYRNWGITVQMSTNGIGDVNIPFLGATTAAFKEYRITFEGVNLTLERGDSLGNLNEKQTITLPRSATAGSSYLTIGTGGCDGFYSPADFDWISVQVTN